MTDFAALRRSMVESQVLPNDVTDRRLLRVLGEVPREAFLAESQKPIAYIDEALKLGGGRVLLAPMQIARLVQLVRLEPEHSVLEIGCGTGYVSALLARLAAKVVALESDPGLALRARQSLATHGQGRVKVVDGPLEAGYAADAPYDAIVVSGSLPEVPETLIRQLEVSGRLVAIVGDGATGRMSVFTRAGSAQSGLEHYDAPLAPLPGFERVPTFVL